MTGSSVGASYDRQRDVLWMLDQAHITVAPDDKGAGGADVTRRGGRLRQARPLHPLRAQREDAPRTAAHHGRRGAS